MRPNIPITLFIVTILLVAPSCDGVLDREPDGSLAIEDIFSDLYLTEAYLNTCYTSVMMGGNTYNWWTRWPVACSDEGHDSNVEGISVAVGPVLKGQASAEDHPFNTAGWAVDHGFTGNFWESYYQAIRNCNTFISNVKDSHLISVPRVKRMLAEVYGLRAHYYLELMKWYGEVVIQPESMSFSGEYSDAVRRPVREVADYILEDCGRALQEQELPWRNEEANDRIRITRAVVHAIRSETALIIASPLFNGGENYWEEAYAMTKDAVETLEANGYALYTELSDSSYAGPVADSILVSHYATLRSEFFTMMPDYSADPTDKETIWLHIEGYQGPMYNMNYFGHAQAGVCPTQELVDAYETIDGQAVLDLENPYLDEQHLSPNYNPANTLYDEQDPYKNRDPRFYTDIVHNGSKRFTKWDYSEVDLYTGENLPGDVNQTRQVWTFVGRLRTGLGPTEPSLTRTGYYQGKFVHPKCSNNNRIAESWFKLYRLAELKLNYAEAATEYDRLAEAEQQINEIRNRVGMPELPSGLSKEMLRLRVRQERRVEMAFEEARYFDVRRWSDPDGDLSKTDRYVTAMHINFDEDTQEFSYERKVVSGLERKCYSNKYLFLPLPIDEINRMYEHTGKNWQNPGW